LAAIIWKQTHRYKIFFTCPRTSQLEKVSCPEQQMDSTDNTDNWFRQLTLNTKMKVRNVDKKRCQVFTCIWMGVELFDKFERVRDRLRPLFCVFHFSFSSYWSVHLNWAPPLFQIRYCYYVCKLLNLYYIRYESNLLLYF